MNRYEHNRLARHADNERRLMGETLAQFHERERPTNTPGDHLTKRRCRSTEDLFSARAPQLFDKVKR